MDRAGIRAGTAAILLIAAGAFLLFACSPTEEGASRTAAEPTTTAPSTATPAATATDLEASSRAGAIFEEGVPGYAFTPIDAARAEALTDKLRRLFGGVHDVDVVARRVETPDGGFVPVRIVAVSYTLPKGVPFEALASEIGREFLKATPENTSGFAGGRGVYMRGRTGGHPSESVAFFIGEDVFVYAFGATPSAPTEKVSKALLEANDPTS